MCRLRFDFSNNGPVDAAQLARVEAICRDWVAAAKPVTSKEVSLAQAKAIKGLRAVFGEVSSWFALINFGVVANQRALGLFLWVGSVTGTGQGHQRPARCLWRGRCCLAVTQS